ncbi:type I secretion system permease/ATPase [Alteriqipengyuania lutimaris]|uniref:ATP-binding cassette domain-containing protein n=1 Tax=Alteriqipengyuania lutimaris TaxID=1538146 RepID=A0A395LSM9_9SPHN|nr:ATP-binding cassette domain-containing protein [Alteriqipengyuania lutimaris]MBB3032409.1 PrtD family type I secretion system ABC transporter [Alteriqipengyuania lutimaris]RDS78444.1 ATP-binding cassette domain-containing protein [Alteriqipengyuania lutimaris]
MTNSSNSETEGGSVLGAILRGEGPLVPYFRAAMLFSLVANLMMLVSPLYMLQVYDRVLTSGSTETLILISAVAALLLVVFAISEMARRRAVALAAAELEAAYDEQIFREALADSDGNTLRVSQGRLSTLQSFLAQGLVLPLFDLPFAPFFLALMFLVHPVIGGLGVLGAAIVLGVAVYSELTTRSAVERAQAAEAGASQFAALLERQRSAVIGMGMVGATFADWQARKGAASAGTIARANENGAFTSIARTLRMGLQIAALGIGAALVLAQETTPGAIIASSIIMGRALAPIDQSVSMWRQLIAARTAWRELGTRLFGPKSRPAITEMPRPTPSLAVENLELAVPGSEKPLAPKFSIRVAAGEVVCLVGTVGSGKTTLLQTLAGVFPPLAGTVRLGGIDLHVWDSTDRGRHIGYLPQDGELVPGTVAQNIARFGDAEREEIFAAARSVGAHDLIAALPRGYDTQVGAGGAHLSRGQVAMIALARAFFREPALILLDEPSANLDRALRESLIELIGREKAAARSVVLLATHDPSMIQLADRVMLLSPARVAAVEPQAYLAGLEQAAAPAGVVAIGNRS